MFISPNTSPSPSPALTDERARYLQRIRRQKLAVRTAKIVVLILFFSIWEWAAQMSLVDPFIVSSPSRLIAAAYRLAAGGELWRHVGVTTGEAAAGFILSTLLGASCAILLWWHPFICKVAEPYLVVLNSLPKIALGPVFIVWIGAGPLSIIVITVTVSVVVSILEILNGFLATDPDLIRLALTFGANKRQIFTKVILPANFGTIVSSLKINVGMSWVGVIVGEYLVSKAGLGYLIVYGSQVFQLDLVMASVLILAIVAGLMYMGVKLLEQFLLARRRR